MNASYCNVSVASMKLEPTDESPLITQLLYGEKFAVEQLEGRWAYGTHLFDGTPGWVLSSQLVKSEIPHVREMIHDKYVSLKTANGDLLLSMGSEPSTNSFAGTIDSRERTIVDTAKELLQVPELTGGRSAFGIDSAAFVQLVYKVHGKSIPRNVPQQAMIGHPYTFLAEAQPGDMAFFEDSDGRINHVGILISSELIVHVDGVVKIDRLDNAGIFSDAMGRHTHKLRFAIQI
ncbi:C40 family peptidase [Planobacterium oryzisoli]|uniref:C40 family peptidase n=1 Tax=Planobacterium oryzisoli TaxID=2771435 RepID=A0A930YWH3_9FLAO|nr:NlpC/P60 family protein [Planobacterium oryzisoli]MBF5027707.1 C40 family peptidase [Planobacterium oryzisoli]